MKLVDKQRERQPEHPHYAHILCTYCKKKRIQLLLTPQTSVKTQRRRATANAVSRAHCEISVIQND
jgi:hypothetical protein